MMVIGNVEVTSLMVEKNAEIRGLSAKEVSVDFGPGEYSRVSRGAEQERSIEESWAEKKKVSPQVYNGAKFRLHDVVVRPLEEVPVVLKMGLTSYKDALGTHYAPDREELISSAKEKGLDPYAHMSNAVGVGSHTLTADGHLVLMKRAGARACAEWAGATDRPGGHAEPDLAMAQQDNCKSHSDLSPESVLRELFEAAAAELRDEVNVPVEHQHGPELLGVVRDLSHGGRCGLEFLIRLKIDKDEVLKRYSTGQQAEAFESEKLIFEPVSRLAEEETSSKEELDKMTPMCRGGMQLLKTRFEVK